jgi:PBP1b-binding outer membrane lipoprotein LpoB
MKNFIIILSLFLGGCAASPEKQISQPQKAIVVPERLLQSCTPPEIPKTSGDMLNSMIVTSSNYKLCGFSGDLKSDLLVAASQEKATVSFNKGILK